MEKKDDPVETDGEDQDNKEALEGDTSGSDRESEQGSDDSVSGNAHADTDAETDGEGAEIKESGSEDDDAADVV